VFAVVFIVLLVGGIFAYDGPPLVEGDGVEASVAKSGDQR
jgi:hypothetical protein